MEREPQWQAGEGLLERAEVQLGLLGRRANLLSSGEEEKVCTSDSQEFRSF